MYPTVSSLSCVGSIVTSWPTPGGGVALRRGTRAKILTLMYYPVTHMNDEDQVWVALLTAGLALAVGGMVVLDSASWHVQYATMGLGLVLVAAGFYSTLQSR